jgi:hypothetical protein
MSQLPCSRMQSNAIALERFMHKPVNKINPNYYTFGCNVNDSLVNKILYLLNWEWTEKEIKEYLEKDLVEHEGQYKIQKRAKAFAKGNDSLYKYALDSLKKEMMLSTQDYLKNQNFFGVDPGLILLSAKLDIKKAVPLLELALLDNIHYSQPSVKLALSRLGNKRIEKEIITQCSYNSALTGQAWNDDFYLKAKKLAFIATQESISRFIFWFDPSKTFSSTASGGPVFKSSSIVLSYLKHMILNKDFQKIIEPFNKDYGEDYSAVNDAMIDSCKEWLKKNKGKYEINRNWIPY